MTKKVLLSDPGLGHLACISSYTFTGEIGIEQNISFGVTMKAKQVRFGPQSLIHNS